MFYALKFLCQLYRLRVLILQEHSSLLNSSAVYRVFHMIQTTPLRNKCSFANLFKFARYYSNFLFFIREDIIKPGTDDIID